MGRTEWRERLTKARELRSKGAGLVYDRAVLYRDVYNDPEFIAFCEESNVNPEDELDIEVGDLCCDAMMLLAILTHFPKKNQWTNQQLDKMQAEVLAEQDTARRKREPTRERRSIKAADFDAVVTQKERLQERLEREAESLKVKDDELTKLRTENRDLRLELAEAKGRILELERQVQLFTRGTTRNTLATTSP